ncbi:MAG: CDP-alcohol phosphatidyltransferase family protein [Ignavibacteriales bacterium]|nr:CDP-alcohol phosphatidyltransferase family protein [Ignavibacteriales bacterium]
MPKQDPITFFKQSLKSESYFADELVNIYLLRPIAAVIVWIFYPTRITPNQVTLMAILLGLASAAAYSFGTAAAIATGGVLIVAKDIFDDADGQLARAKKIYSRRGRFLDSIGDFIVDVALFSSITYIVYIAEPTGWIMFLGILSFIGITLRVSYHVYYQVSFFHLENQYPLNRTAEEITEEDLEGDRLALRLQKIFILIYGWQDKLMLRIDRWCKGRNFDKKLLATWYSDRLALRISGLLGFGTEFMLMCICSWINELQAYLIINVIVMNGIWMVSIFYRRFILARNLA